MRPSTWFTRDLSGLKIIQPAFATEKAVELRFGATESLLATGTEETDAVRTL
jgi:hypothetical protein